MIKINKLFVLLVCLQLLVLTSQAKSSAKNDRAYWIKTMLKIVDPIYINLSNNTLRANMPIEVNDGLNNGKRADVTHLEALGRSFCGIAPWLSLGADETKEGQLRAKYIDLCIKSITNAVNPDSPDYMRFDGPGTQPLVDAAFFAQGLIRSKNQIWNKLDLTTQSRIIKELKSSLVIKPYESNWLLFSAMIETALLQFSGECNMEPIYHAINQHKKWYLGDGVYGDGPHFHADYYNSFVIQPMLMDVLKVLKDKKLDNDNFYDVQMKRFVRYAQIQELQISPEGTYPALGRSSAYRFGAFQVLAQAALLGVLPSTTVPAQVRCGLTAVIKRQMKPKDTFDKNGWLQIGVYGHQKEIAEHYISTGSLYLCTFAFLPLGLDAKADFWSGDDAEWSQLKIWSGKKVTRDGALYD